jgi:uncharacterized protein (TIGR02271 family)
MKRDNASRNTRTVSHQSKSIPVVQENVVVDKQVIDNGRVNFKKDIDQEEKVIEARASHDEVTVQRVRIDKVVDAPPPAVRYEGNKMIISVLKEEIVVQKRLILVEELHVTKQTVTQKVRRPITVKKERVTVKQKGPAGPHLKKTF